MHFNRMRTNRGSGHLVWGGGWCLPDPPPNRHPLSPYHTPSPLWTNTYVHVMAATAAGGTHPTRMYSCASRCVHKCQVASQCSVGGTMVPAPPSIRQMRRTSFSGTSEKPLFFEVTNGSVMNIGVCRLQKCDNQVKTFIRAIYVVFHVHLHDLPRENAAYFVLICSGIFLKLSQFFFLRLVSEW